MNNNANEIMSDGISVSFDECMDNLLNTRDMELYLKTLTALKDRYLIIFSVKDNPGINMPDEILKKIHDFGFSNFCKTNFKMFIGIADRGGIILNKCGEKAEDAVEYSAELNDRQLSCVSKSWNKGNLSEVKIDGIDYSLNCRGVNMVVYDYETNRVIDSSTYDSHTLHPTFYHKNMIFDENYFDEHFFIPQKYQEAWREPFRKKYYSNRKLNVVEVENGIILPNKSIGDRVYGGVCDENFNFISGHQTYMSETGETSRNITGSYRVENNEIEYINETVLYGGTIIDYIGHQIVECFADRLWWLARNRSADVKIAIINIWGDGSRFTYELLSILGITKDKIISLTCPTKFKKIIVPEQSSIPLFWHHRIYDYTNEYYALFQKLCVSIEPSEFKKIYFTKSKTLRGNIIGEEFFVEFYRKKGFKIINPEDYTLKEKISFMMGADEFVSPIGTSTLYSIFCRSNVKITILSRIKNSFMACAMLVFNAANISNIYCVDVSGNFMHNDFIDGLSLMYVTDEFKKYVKKEFGEELEITPEYSLKQNLYDYLSYIPKYYANSSGTLGKSHFFDCIKNQKMLTVLQNMSEVFLGKEFDTAGLNLTTNEDKLNGKIKQLTMDLNASQKRVAELEKNDICEAAKRLDSAYIKLEEQITELQTALQAIRNFQTKIDELVVQNSALEKQVRQTNVLLEKQAEKIERLREKVDDPQFRPHQ